MQQIKLLVYLIYNKLYYTINYIINLGNISWNLHNQFQSLQFSSTIRYLHESDIRHREGHKESKGPQVLSWLMGPLIAVTRPQVYDVPIAKGDWVLEAHVLAKCSVIRDFQDPNYRDNDSSLMFLEKNRLLMWNRVFIIFSKIKRFNLI